MVREIGVALLDNPVNGDGFALHITSESDFVDNTTSFVFKPLPGGLPNYITIGTTVTETINNLYNFAVAKYSIYSFITVTLDPEFFGIIISVSSENVDSNTSGPITGEITVGHITTVEYSDTSYTNILSRSPYNVGINPTEDFDKATLDLKIWRGHLVDDYPIDVTYPLSKLVTIAGQPRINFNITNIVNDFVKNSYQAIGATGSFTTSSLDSVWVEADITAYYLGVMVGNTQKKYFALDGYGKYIELANPVINKKVLSTINSHIIYEGDYPLYFFTEGLTSITVNGTTIPFTFDPLYNNQVVGYVNISQYIGSSTSFNAVFVYGSGEEAETITHSFTVKDECKYPVINCIFKNRWGVWQTIPFNKLSKSTLDVEASDYNGLVAEYGNYNLNQHNKKAFNVNGRDKMTVNSDFIPESYNDLFIELMLSEFVYLKVDGLILPVNHLKKSFEKKTRLINKLIQYTFEFEYSFEHINNVV